MKKLAIIFLCVIMALSLLACGSTGDNGAAQTTAAAQTNEFSVGFGRVESTPSMGISLQGYDKAADRKCTSVLDPLYITCVAIRDDQGNTAILITSDSIRTEAKVANSIRRKLEEKYGIPQENTFFTSTHSHSTPDSMAVDSVGMAVEAADKAIADLKAAKMYIGTGRTDNLNFVRHYIMDDGSIVGDNYGDPTGKTYVKHETEADNEIRLIKFTREGQKDIVMMNWQVHPLITGGPTNTEVSADIVGACRMTMEKELDCYVAYFSGASGNLDPVSRISSENVVNGYVQHGTALAKAAMKGLENMTEVESGPVKSVAYVYPGKVLKDSAERLAAGQKFKAVYEAGGTVEEAMKASGGLIHSIYAVSGMNQHNSLGETKDINMYALSVGNVAFVGAEYEMFDTNGQEIRKDSPFEMTFICCYCNGKNGYIPSAIAFENGCYEMDNGYYAPGTGEELVKEYLRLLNEIK